MTPAFRTHACSSARALAMLCLVLVAAVLWAPAVAHAEGVLLDVPMRGDVSYDDTSGILYVTTVSPAGSAVLRYDVAADRFLEAFPVPGSPRGIDLSPDGSILAVADATHDASSGRLHLVDTVSGAVRTVTVPSGGAWSGTYQVAFGADGRVRFTVGADPWFGEGGDLLDYDPATGELRTIASHIGLGSVISASGDRQTIALGESSPNEDGPWGVLRVADDVLTQYHFPNGTGTSSRSAATNRDGTLQAFFGYYDTQVYGPGPTLLTTLDLGVSRFHPTEDVLYGFRQDEVAPYGLGRYEDVIAAISTTAFAEIGRWPLGSVPRSSAFREPRLAVSRDSRHVFATVEGGVRVVPLGPSLEGSVRSTYQGVPVEGAVVEFWRAGATGWSVESTRTTREGGTWCYPTDDLSPLRVRVSDPGGIHPSVWIGGTSLETAADLVAQAGPKTPRDVTLEALSLGSLVGKVVSSFGGGPIGGVWVSLCDGTGVTVLAWTQTATDGTYRFDGLGPASFRLGFTDPASAHCDIYSRIPDSPPASFATVTHTGVMTMPTATLVFIPFGVGVDVAFPNSAMTPPATVELWRESPTGGFAMESSTTASAGSASFATNLAEPVRVRVQDASGFYGPAWYGGGVDATSALPVTPTRSLWVGRIGVHLPLEHPAAISGVVRSGYTGLPVAGAQVELFPNRPYAWAVLSTVTDAEGRYRFAEVGPGEWVVGSSDPSGQHYASWAGGQPPGSDPAPIAVTVPGESLSRDATMSWIPLSLAGTVRSESFGLPVSGATVVLWRKGASGTYTQETTLTADAAGAWSYTADDDSPVRVLVTDGDGFHGPFWMGGAGLADASDILPSRASPVPRTDVTMTLSAPGSIAGTVRSTKDGLPIENVDVSLFANGSVEPVAVTATDAEGAYAFVDLGRAAYTVYFEDWSGAHEPQESASVAMSAPAAASVDATLTYVEPSVIGVVHSSAGSIPVSDASVEIWRMADTGWQFETTVTAGYDGWWIYTVDDPRPIRVRAVDPTGMHDPVWYAGVAGLPLATSIVPGYDWGSFAEIDMQLVRPATVRGTVRSSLTGAPLAGVNVVLHTAYDGFSAFGTTTAADGTYSLPGLPPSAYLASYESPSGRYKTQWWDKSTNITYATPIEVWDAATTVIDIALAPVLTDVPRFTAAAFSDSGPGWVGQTLPLRGELVNNITGRVLSGKRLTLQCSTDGVNWTDTPTRVFSRGGGIYEADVVLDAAWTRYYRFVAPGTEFAPGAVSGGALLVSRAMTLEWLGMYIGGDWRSGGYADKAPASGAPTRVWAYATGFGSENFGYWNTPFVLQRSTDGRTWVDDPTVVVTRNVLEVSAVVPATPGLYRFILRAPRFVQPIVTRTAQFYVPSAITITRSTSGVRYPKPFVLQGVLTSGAARDACVVEVRKPGSRRWSYSSARLAYGVSGASAKWWYRYTPKLRGTYTFRVRYAGDKSRGACVSGIVTVKVR
jgi:protocatechuate 3,4-dioxygenase beta subunit